MTDEPTRIGPEDAELGEWARKQEYKSPLRELLESRSIVVTDLGYRIEEAPQEAELTLELVQSSDPRGLKVRVDQVVFGRYPDTVTYQVVGWNPESAVLMLRRAD